MKEHDREALLALLTEKSFEKRPVVLASGRKSDFYFDCKQVTLWPSGLVLVGNLLFDAIVRFEEENSIAFSGVGGLTLGADPIAAAVSLTSAQKNHPFPAFIVRKETKKHGTQAYLEGMSNIPEGSPVLVLEDVVTTGGSALVAVDRVRAAGYEVPLVLALVDRMEGGREKIESRGLALVSLFDRRDFIQDAG